MFTYVQVSDSKSQDPAGAQESLFISISSRAKMPSWFSVASNTIWMWIKLKLETNKNDSYSAGKFTGICTFFVLFLYITSICIWTITHDENLLFEHLHPTLTKYFPPDLSLQTPHRENNLPAVRRPWLSVMDRSGAKRELDKVCVFHYNNFSVWGRFFSFKVLNRCPSNFVVICTHENILRV